MVLTVDCVHVMEPTTQYLVSKSARECRGMFVSNLALS